MQGTKKEERQAEIDEIRNGHRMQKKGQEERDKKFRQRQIKLEMDVEYRRKERNKERWKKEQKTERKCNK